VRAPELLAGGGVVGGDEAAQAGVSGGPADQDLAPPEGPRRVHRGALFGVDHLRLPLHLAGPGVERDQLVVGGGDEDLPGAKVTPRLTGSDNSRPGPARKSTGGEKVQRSLPVVASTGKTWSSPVS
jgi:hypothetical protein